MKTVTAVVTYNRRELLEEAIDALLHQNTETEILIIDNASTDGTAEMLRPLADAGKIRYINTGSNLGGAGGFSRAMEEALKLGADYVWIMDDDTIVKPDSLDRLLEQAAIHPEAAFFSSQALWTDGTPNRMNDQRLLESTDGKEAVACREATFVSLLLRAGCIREAGLPYQEFFIWGDDIEYTRRLSFRYGGYYVPGSVVVHKTAGNAGSNITYDSLQRLPRYRYAYRNEVFMARKEGFKREVRQLAKIMYHTARTALFSREAKGEKIRLIWSASKEGLHFNPQIRYPETGSATGNNEKKGKGEKRT